MLTHTTHYKQTEERIGAVRSDPNKIVLTDSKGSEQKQSQQEGSSGWCCGS